ncbi:MAG: TadE/TadG family type IV pilus assembly protein [Chloroflexota bacterium]|nr:TadE/TadG family type IV pilus assembly protein [Chloroflexota bacterium]
MITLSWWRRVLARLRRGQSGQGYVEFVIVLPSMMLLLLLLWEFSLFWWSRMVVSTATFEAARRVAAGQPASTGYAVYNEILDAGIGRMADQHRGDFTLIVQPGMRSVRATANVPYHWPEGLEALMGGDDVDLHLKASAFFRLEQFFAGPPGVFE